MGGSLSTEEEGEFTIERSSNVRSEKDLTTSTRKLLTPKEEERLNQKREEVRAIREQNKALTLRTRMRMEMSQKLTQEFKERVIIDNNNNNKEGNLKGLKRNVKRTRNPREQLEHKSAVKIQALWKGYRIRRKYGKIGKRTVVAKELLETEKDYIQYLTALVNVYLKPLREKAESDTPLLTVEEVRTIFPQLEMILLYNKQLYEALDSRIRVKWNAEQTIGDAFLTLIDSLKQPYTHYISHFPVISQQIKNVAKRIRVSMYFNSKKNLPECGGLDLSALASMPFQRIPRYILLLREVIKNTHSTHPDHAYLEEAISRMDVLAKTANEKLRENETQRSLQSISERLDPPIKNLIKPFRKLIREGSMRYKINHSVRRTPTGFRTGLIFLFTDCLMITEISNKSVAKLFSDSGVTKLRPIDVLNLHNSTVLNIMEDYKDRNVNCYDFRLHSLQATVIFELESVVLKDAWINDIAQAINSLTETAISYKSKVRRKSVAHGINRKSSSVRLPANVSKSLLNSEESLLSSSSLSFSPATPPLAHTPTLGATPSTPTPNIASPSMQRVVATTPSTPRMSLPQSGDNNVNISSLPALLSIQRYTSNLNQSGSLYYDNTPPSSPSIILPPSTPPKTSSSLLVPTSSQIEHEQKPAPHSPKKATPPSSVPSKTSPKISIPRSSSPKSSSLDVSYPAPLSLSQPSSSLPEDNIEKKIKAYSSEFGMEINVSIDQLNHTYDEPVEGEDEEKTTKKENQEEEKEEEKQEENEEEEQEKNGLTIDESDILLQKLNSLEMDNFGTSDTTSSSDRFETYDEMAIRITDTLDTRQSFIGITRTNSEGEISSRNSLAFHSLPRSSSFSNLDGLLGR